MRRRKQEVKNKKGNNDNNKNLLTATERLLQDYICFIEYIFEKS